MVNILDGDRINISMTDTRILVALLMGPMSGYEIARQCEKDSERNNKGSISNGLVYKSIKGLIDCRLVERLEAKALKGAKRPGANVSVYAIADVGRWLLQNRLQGMQDLIDLARRRS